MMRCAKKDGFEESENDDIGRERRRDVAVVVGKKCIIKSNTSELPV